MKKVLAIVLAFAMLLPVLSVNVFADEVRKDVFTYDFNSQQITGYTGVLGDSIADFVEAIQMEGAEVELEYTVQTEGWIQISLQGNGNTYVDGSGNVIVAPTDPIVVTNATTGTTYYADMETALANVQDGDTITLRNNVEVHKMVDITVSNVILDLGGFTLTAADDFSCTMGNKNDAHVINISANGVTVRNGTVKATANNKHAINVYQVDGAVLENVTADHTDSTTGAPIVIGGSDVTVKGRLTTITGMNSWYAINVDSYAGMESNITFAQNSTVAFEGVSPLGIYIETNSTADTDDVTVTFDKNVSVIAPEGVSDFTAVATDENATNASVVNPGNAGLKDNGDGTYGLAPI